VLRNPAISGTSHRLGSPSPDPRAAALLDEARKEGYDQGFAAGAAAAEATIRRVETEAIARIERALTAASAGLRAELGAFGPELTRLAVQVARRLVAEVPETVASGLERRIGAALEALDDDDLVLRLNPDDAARLRTFTRRLEGATVETDPGLAPGDARLVGRWSRADLTMETAWRIVEEQVCG
jgi:flagellar biosynthesis/type III secretory pathway protein FliH